LLGSELKDIRLRLGLTPLDVSSTKFAA